MPYSKLRGFLTSLICFIVLALFLTTSRSFVHAGDQEEKKVAWFLVDSLNKPNVTFEQLSEQWKLLGKESKYYVVATQALAMRKFADKRFSEAWKILKSCDEEIGKAPTVLQLGHDALKIWLLLETQKPEHVKPALQAFAKKVTASEVASADNYYGIEWLAKFVAIISQSPEMKTTYKNELSGIDILLKKTAQGSQKQFRMALESSQNEMVAVDEQFKQVQGMTVSEREMALQQDRESLDSLQTQVESHRATGNALEEEFRNVDRQWKQLVGAYNKKEHELKHTRASGEPTKPKEPKRPRQRQNIDNERERMEQQRELQEYYASVRRYEIEYAAYEEAYAVWRRKDEERRDKIKAELVQIGQDRDTAASDRKLKQSADEESQKRLRKLQSTFAQEEFAFARLSDAIQFVDGLNSNSDLSIVPSRLRSLDVQVHVAKLNYIISQLN